MAVLSMQGRLCGGHLQCQLRGLGEAAPFIKGFHIELHSRVEDGPPLGLHRAPRRLGREACGHRALAGDDHQSLGVK